ncbi:MAG: CbiX/SirB N-terminal domain-containing protein [Betaproteobacteria bacterium]|nr:CbiX/SirB N-terminal domain-containing protein [Betaproteobacteria bacterium]
MPNADHALLLFSHGSPDPEWARPLESLRDRLAAALPHQPVALAFLPPAEPDFGAVVADLAQAGVTRVTVSPVFLARGGHVKRDLPEMAAAATRMHGIAFTILPTLGESDVMLSAIAQWILDQTPGRS